MPGGTLNLGILAHVDAGKTTLTERLLYAAGVIDAIGSVDDGTTQTDTLALERQRGITIKTAVASFAVGDMHVNLIDTPGHPDFIAEVERALAVLDGAVLVVSAVEGVQPQTRILMRALRRLRIPTLLFVNKIDRPGADGGRVLRALAEQLTPAVVALGRAREQGTRGASFSPFEATDGGFRERLAETLAEHDEALLAAWVADEAGLAYARLRAELAAQTRRALVHPVLFGSAITGAGVEELMGALPELLPSGSGDRDSPLSAAVFKIERTPSGEKVAYARLFTGTLRVRDRVRFGDGLEGKVTALAVFERGPARQRPSVAAGEVAKIRGLREIRIGDRIGEADAARADSQFTPPMLESAIDARDPSDRARLRAALAQLAEQDPLIDVRQSDELDELSVSLYGEVQKQVIEATLAADYGLEVAFRETTTICVERPAGHGEAVEILHAETNPFPATIGLRVEPAPEGSGLAFRLDVANSQRLPLYTYGRRELFVEAMEGYVREALLEGLYGWRVVDCVVTLVDCNYQSPDGPPSTRGGLTKAADIHRLTPIVLMQALARSGTVVCEPVVHVALELPPDAIGPVAAALGRLGATAGTPSLRGRLAVVETLLPTTRAQELQRQLPGLTRGEGTLESTFAGYLPVGGEPPTRRRTSPDPRNLAEYLLHLSKRRAPPG